MNAAKVRQRWADHPNDREFCYSPVEFFDDRACLKRQTVIKELVLSRDRRTEAIIFVPGGPADPSSMQELTVRFASLTPLEPEAVDPAVDAWFSEHRDIARQQKILADQRRLATETLGHIPDEAEIVLGVDMEGNPLAMAADEARAAIEHTLQQIDATVAKLSSSGAALYAAWVDSWTNGARPPAHALRLTDWGLTLGG